MMYGNWNFLYVKDCIVIGWDVILFIWKGLYKK